MHQVPGNLILSRGAPISLHGKLGVFSWVFPALQTRCLFPIYIAVRGEFAFLKFALYIACPCVSVQTVPYNKSLTDVSLRDAFVRVKKLMNLRVMNGRFVDFQRSTLLRCFEFWFLNLSTADRMWSKHFQIMLPCIVLLRAPGRMRSTHSNNASLCCVVEGDWYWQNVKHTFK